MKIALSIVLAFFVLGCSEQKETTETEVADVKVEAPKTEVQKSVVTQIKENVAEATEATTATVTETVDTLAQKTEETTASVAQAVDSLKEKTTEAVSAVQSTTASITDTVVAQTIDAKALYAGCIGCHGSNGEKKALGKSAVIQGWDSAKTEAALNGYKDGSYGGAMKAIMKGQADKFDGAQTKAIADYIAGL